MFVLLPHLVAVAVSPLRIEGLVAAVFSPFDAAGMLNTSVVPLQNAYLHATGVDWVFVGGTTGESLSLSLTERKALTEAWLSTSASVIVHVGAECLGDARSMAAHAQAHGAKAIGAMPPTFFKAANVQALAATLASICAAAPELPCYYYHIPSMTGAYCPNKRNMLCAPPPLHAHAARNEGGRYLPPQPNTQHAARTYAHAHVHAHACTPSAGVAFAMYDLVVAVEPLARTLTLTLTLTLSLTLALALTLTPHPHANPRSSLSP